MTNDVESSLLAELGMCRGCRCDIPSDRRWCESCWWGQPTRKEEPMTEPAILTEAVPLWTDAALLAVFKSALLSDRFTNRDAVVAVTQDEILRRMGEARA